MPEWGSPININPDTAASQASEELVHRRGPAEGITSEIVILNTWETVATSLKTLHHSSVNLSSVSGALQLFNLFFWLGFWRLLWASNPRPLHLSIIFTVSTSISSREGILQSLKMHQAEYLNKRLTAAWKRFSLAPYWQSWASFLSVIGVGDYSD